MKGLQTTYGHSKRLCLLRPWVAVQLILVALTCTPPLSGQYLYESVSYSIGSDGTIYATGVTNAAGMQQHSAWVVTNIVSPTGRAGEGQQSVSSGGYAVANASLAFDQNDLGEYTISAYGSGT